jgi:hypothetical protein
VSVSISISRPALCRALGSIARALGFVIPGRCEASNPE